MEEQLKNIQEQLQRLEDQITNHRQNINLLNSVFSGLNKFISFLYEDSRRNTQNINATMDKIVKKQEKQSKILKDIANKLERLEVSSDSKSN